MTQTNSFLRLSLLLLSGLLVASCGTIQTTESLTSGNQIESGVASWYGPDFHGKATANGETYNMDDLTAAHRTLPFNTWVRVTNHENGKSVDVRINDRGPYVGNRIIDLSREAARRIDMIGPGTAEVNIYFLEEGDRPLSEANTSSRESFTVQLASFETRDRAEEKSREITGSRVEAVTSAGTTVYRVYYGSWSSPDGARRALRQLQSAGHSGFVKQEEN
ncbi:MAG: septal ring lytic transglycosylase RlpA family protein [Balneolaceae bacterium]